MTKDSRPMTQDSRPKIRTQTLAGGGTARHFRTAATTNWSANMNRSICVLFVCLSIIVAVQATAQEKRSMTFDDVMALKNIGLTSVSPDGKSVLYTVAYADM